MNINKQYAWRPAEDCRENIPLLPRNLRGKTRVILLQPGWLDYNHLYMFGQSPHCKNTRF